MSSSISAVGSYASTMAQNAQGTQRAHHRPDPSQMADRLFSKLDTSGKGYLEIADLQGAIDQAGGSTSADEVFASLDADSDGKVTKQEMSDSIKKMADALEQQFHSSRMNGAMAHMGGHGGMPPPPPPNDAGFTKDELSSQLSAIGDSDSKRASFISKIVDNFEAADSDGNGKVSFKEAVAFDKASKADSGTSPAANSTSAVNATGASTDGQASNSNDDNRVVMQIMRLVAAYRDFGASSAGSSSGSNLSVTA